MIATFTKEQFEKSALPSAFVGTDVCPWEYVGLVDGEHAYEIYLGHDALCKIQVRSSVCANNVSAGTGQNSIRAWLTTLDGEFVGSKAARWVDRRPGWAKRTFKMIHTLSVVGKQLKVCPKCGNICNLFKCGKHKNPDNIGRWFLTCKNDHQDKQPFYQWLELWEEEE